MGFRVNKTIVMVGMMGAGKTAVGTTLARMLDVPFLDSDEEIVKASNMSIAEIFARDGEAFFRQKESQVIKRLMEEARCVLSTGGGAFMTADNRLLIHDLGVSVWLNADLDLLWNRVKHKDTRPLLRTENPYATLSALYTKRVPVYAQADLSVAVQPHYSVTDTAGAVRKVLKTRPDVLEEV